MRKALLVATAITALAAIPVATAHIGPTPSSAAAGGTTIVGFAVGHGCEGSPTRRVTIQIPAGVTAAKPRPKAGWTISIKKGKLPQPVKDFAGNTVTTGVLEITWTGGPLRDDNFDTFDIRLGMPDTPGKTIYFKTIQQCVKGVYRWIQIPVHGQPEPDEPAPGVALTKSSGGH